MGSTTFSRIFSEAFSQGIFEAIDELLSVKCIRHNLPQGKQDGRRSLKHLISIFRSAFSDLECKVMGELYQDNRWSAHCYLSGTHQGNYQGNPPTLKEIRVQVMIFTNIYQDQIVEYWLLVDQFVLLQQLGILPG